MLGSNYTFSAPSLKYCEGENGAMFAVNASDANTNAASILLSQQPQAPQTLQQQQQQPQHHDPQQQQSSQQIEQQNDVDVKEHSNNGKRKHCVWDYYQLVNGKAGCRSCQRVISATTTLAKGHLKAFHPDVLAEVEQKEEHRRVLNPTQSTPKRRKTPQLPSQQQQQQQQMQQLQLLGNDAALNARVYDNKAYLSFDYLNAMINNQYPISKLAQILPLVRMSRTETFSAAHRLHNAELSEHENRQLYGKCNNAHGHGHNYEWKVVLEGPLNSHTGMVYDLTALKRAMQEVLDTVDHKNLDLDNDYFRNNRLVSTTENLCVYLFNQMKGKLDRPELLKKVVVSETNKNRFSYSGG